MSYTSVTMLMEAYLGVEFLDGQLRDEVRLDEGDLRRGSWAR